MITAQSNIETARMRALKLLRTNREHRVSSYDFAKKLALVFRDYVNLSKCKDVQELILLIQSEGDYLLSLYPSEFFVHNVRCTTLKFIREEAQKMAFGEENDITAFDSLIKLWNDPKDSELKVDMKELKGHVMGSIEEYTVDLDASSEEMAEKALDHVTASSIVMTLRYSKSDTLQNFLKDVKCTILSVDDVECQNPKKLPYIATSPTDIVIKMNTVTRIVLSAIAVLPDGSCVMPAGTRAICEIAKLHSIPVIICSAFYKFTPIFFPNLNEFNQHGAAGPILGNDTELLSSFNLRVTNPLFDHIPAKLVSLYITQDSVETPSHVYNVLTESYHPADLYSFNKNQCPTTA
ncbi:Translation initiation factor eIF-2B subunit beta [Aphelenchoides bicaudatus]|nr:Translation initiation factor eIF-2B subunit beta [Aphelenchoides bicaudatus]